MLHTLRRPLPAALPLLFALAATACRGDRNRNASEPADSTASDSSSLGATDSVEIAFVRWWRAHAAAKALRQPATDSVAPVSNVIVYKLAGGDTVASGDQQVQI